MLSCNALSRVTSNRDCVLSKSLFWMPTFLYIWWASHITLLDILRWQHPQPSENAWTTIMWSLMIGMNRAGGGWGGGGFPGPRNKERFLGSEEGRQRFPWSSLWRKATPKTYKWYHSSPRNDVIGHCLLIWHDTSFLVWENLNGLLSLTTSSHGFKVCLPIWNLPATWAFGTGCMDCQVV